LTFSYLIKISAHNDSKFSRLILPHGTSLLKAC